MLFLGPKSILTEMSFSFCKEFFIFFPRRCHVNGILFFYFCRFRAKNRLYRESRKAPLSPVPPTESTRPGIVPPANTDPNLVFFCRHAYDSRTGRILKNPFYWFAIFMSKYTIYCSIVPTPYWVNLTPIMNCKFALLVKPNAVLDKNEFQLIKVLQAKYCLVFIRPTAVLWALRIADMTWAFVNVPLSLQSYRQFIRHRRGLKHFSMPLFMPNHCVIFRLCRIIVTNINHCAI